MHTQGLSHRLIVTLVGGLLLGVSAGALADPPSRVARLAYVDGPVSFSPVGDNNWVYASLNRPLTAGDRLWSDPGGRDELQVGSAALRMGDSTLVTVLALDDRRTQLQLSQGRLNVRVRWLARGESMEVDTPNLALAIRQPGDYRVEVDPNGAATMVAVLSGQADAYGEGNAYRLDSGQAFSFAGTDLRDVQYVRPNWDDDFDRWSDARDRRHDHARTARYVPRDLIGYEDLDDNGSWRSVPAYGNVWIPANVGSDWAPYRDGHWSWVEPWGWTWVDDAPWGFAVSHYGRWARLQDSWCWVPGPRLARPVYAPALVAFVGFGSGAFVQRDRPVAWFPLAPREVYRPSYRASPTYITNVNITNTTVNRTQITNNVTNVRYVNRQVGGAVTAVPADAFVHARPVAKAALALPVAALAAAAVSHAPPAAPQADSRLGGARPGHQPPPAAATRPVLARSAPPPPRAAMPATVAAAPHVTVLAPDRQGGRGTHQLRHVPPQPPQAAATAASRPAAPGQAGHPAAPPSAVLPRVQDSRTPGRIQAAQPPVAVAPLAHGTAPMTAPSQTGAAMRREQAVQGPQHQPLPPHPAPEVRPVPPPQHPAAEVRPVPLPPPAAASARPEPRGRNPLPPQHGPVAPQVVPQPPHHDAAPQQMPQQMHREAAPPQMAQQIHREAPPQQMRREPPQPVRRDTAPPPVQHAPPAPHAPPPPHAPPAPAPHPPEPAHPAPPQAEHGHQGGQPGQHPHDHEDKRQP